jgi:hypothetical protein
MAVSFNRFGVRRLALTVGARHTTQLVEDEVVVQKQPMKAGYNRPIEEKTGWSTRSADSQKDSILIVGQRIRAIGRWSTRRSTDGEEEGGNRRHTPKGKHGGGGSIYD